MRHFLMSSGAQIHRAPEDDRGLDFDIDLDADFDDPDDVDDEGDQDEGDDADQDEGDDADDPDDAPPQRQAKKPSRQTQRVQNALREAKEAQARADALEARLSQMEGTRHRDTQAETEAAERELLATMTPEQRLDYKMDKLERVTQQRISATQMQSADLADKAAFDALCARDKTLASIQSQVEDAVRKARQQGSTADRDTIANYLLGKMLREKGAKVGQKQRRQAASNREREQGRPGAARSDTRGSSGKPSDRAARAKRLDGQLI